MKLWYSQKFKFVLFVYNYVTILYRCLLCIHVGFLPPLFAVNCFTNGSVLLDWSAYSSRNLSSNYLKWFTKSWTLKGSCNSQQGDVFEVNTIIYVNLLLSTNLISSYSHSNYTIHLMFISCSVYMQMHFITHFR